MPAPKYSSANEQAALNRVNMLMSEIKKVFGQKYKLTLIVTNPMWPDADAVFSEQALPDIQRALDRAKDRARQRQLATSIILPY